jgi:hypothetical protein
MTDYLSCPKCGTPVPVPPGHWTYGSGSGPETAQQPWRQRSDCPNPDCAVTLIREADPPSPWRVDDDRANLG